MKLQIISDTHTYNYCLSLEADLIIHLGDFGNGNIRHIKKFKDDCDAINKPHLCVMGNHDFYGQKIQDVYAALKLNGINYLREGKEFVFQGKTFVGGTLFSDFTLNGRDPWNVDKAKIEASANIYDFIAILQENGQFITPDEYVTMHNIQKSWINKYRNRDDVIVCTHFPPHPICLTDYWKEYGGLINAYFINTLDLTGFNHWFSGHIHSAIDVVQDGCRIVVNPQGYANEHDMNGFRPGLIIEV